MPRFDTAPPMYAPPPVSATAQVGTATTNSRIVIDGTPMRIVTLAMAAAGGIVLLRYAGFKFNVAI